MFGQTISMNKNNKIVTLVLRFLAFGATLAAVVLMVTSHDSVDVMNLKFDAKYTNTPAFKYFVVAEGIACGYSLIAVFVAPNDSARRLIILLDMVIALLLSSSISAALAIAEVGKKGNSHAGWLPICDQVPKFCDHVTGSLISGFVSAILYSLLILYSSYTIMYNNK